MRYILQTQEQKLKAMRSAAYCAGMLALATLLSSMIVTFAFAQTAQQGTVEVRTNVQGGANTPDDFTTRVRSSNTTVDQRVVDSSGANVNYSTSTDASGNRTVDFSGSTQPQSVYMGSGTYDVAASGVANNLHQNYVVTRSGDCSGTLSTGQTRTCTLTYEPRSVAQLNLQSTAPAAGTARIVVTPIVTGTTLSAQNTSFRVNALGASLVVNQPSDQDSVTFNGQAGGTVVTAQPGPYAVIGNQIGGYSPTYGDNCVGSLSAGETRYCTLTYATAGTPGVPNTGAGGAASSWNLQDTLLLGALILSIVVVGGAFVQFTSVGKSEN